MSFKIQIWIKRILKDLSSALQVQSKWWLNMSIFSWRSNSTNMAVYLFVCLSVCLSSKGFNETSTKAGWRKVIVQWSINRCSCLHLWSCPAWPKPFCWEFQLAQLMYEKCTTYINYKKKSIWIWFQNWISSIFGAFKKSKIRKNSYERIFCMINKDVLIAWKLGHKKSTFWAFSVLGNLYEPGYQYIFFFVIL